MRWSLLNLNKGILGKRGQGLLLLGLFLSLLALANFSYLHKAIHSDAGSPDHQCAVTLLVSGPVESALNEAALIVAVGLILFCFKEAPAAVQSFPFLPPGRGPPAFSHN
jgi:hypothetical protein